MDYEIRLTEEFSAWLDGLKDSLAREAIAARLIRARRGNLGDHKSVGGGVSELRLRIGPGYRAYYTIRGRQIVFMLVGGTKRTQDKDIVRAKHMAQEI